MKRIDDFMVSDIFKGAGQKVVIAEMMIDDTEENYEDKKEHVLEEPIPDVPAENAAAALKSAYKKACDESVTAQIWVYVSNVRNYGRIKTFLTSCSF